VHLSFHPLRVIERVPAASDAVCLVLEVPAALRAEYEFEPGQHVALRATLAGREVRRTYSIIDAAADGRLRLGIRVQPPGGMSHHLAHGIRVGEPIDTLAPTGRFVYRRDTGTGRVLLALAGGSGITPILSIIGAALEHDSEARVVLIYGNRSVATTMFTEEIYALKNRHLDRLAVHFIMSREPQEMEVFNGRIDAAKLGQLAGRLYTPAAVDEVYVCGPGDMVNSCRGALAALGLTAPVHFERFTTGAAGSAAGAAAQPSSGKSGAATITVLQDGRRRSFEMNAGDESVLAAAERAGLELPYSCRSGVCSTCRVKVVNGTVSLAHNVALEDWELAAGYTLACQARPTSRSLELSYDEK
jgi:ring-1,2-phenylacetyl-CoA epoxidase subunit PaaE